MTNAKQLFDTKNFKKLSLIYLSCYLLATTITKTNACSSRAIPKPRPSSTYISSSPSSSSIAGTALPTRAGSNSNYASTAATTTTTTYRTTTATTTTTSTTASTTTTTSRPNITFPVYKCPATYDAWYCLNAATCFSIKLGDSIMYNCECANGFIGPRCEFKELDGSYLPKRPRPVLEKASIASGATCALLFMLFICLTLYMRFEHKPKSVDENDGDGISSTSPNSAFKYIADALHEDDEYEDGGIKCRHCNDKRCCGDGIGLLNSNDVSFRVRQHIETFPISFKRNTKW